LIDQNRRDEFFRDFEWLIDGAGAAQPVPADTCEGDGADFAGAAAWATLDRWLRHAWMLAGEL
jgi:hypothetical protein